VRSGANDPPPIFLPEVRRSGWEARSATSDDRDVAAAYFEWPDKGDLIDGIRLTVMSGRTSGIVGGEFRIVHALEIVVPGRELYVMGPKPVLGEYVDDQLVSRPAPDDEEAWIPVDYDGATVPSPGVDCNYAVSCLWFSSAGTRTVSWQLGPLRSNQLRLRIEGGAP